MKNLKTAKKKGFSLVELLVVIAVIGVIAAIAIPAMTNIFGSSRTAKARRNAQNLASAFSAAQAAGADTAAATDPATACGLLTSATGLHGQGQFSTSVFKVNLAAPEVTEAITNGGLAFQDGTLVYTGTGGDIAP